MNLIICLHTATLYPETSNIYIYTVNQKKHTRMFFLIHSLGINFSYRNVNVVCLTQIVSLPYLVKLSICMLQVNSS